IVCASLAKRARAVFIAAELFYASTCTAMSREQERNEAISWKRPSGLFATQTLTGHVIRGAVAFALLYLAIEQQHLHPVASLSAGVPALVLMRGCPVCWTIGLKPFDSVIR